ncbi:MAG: TIM barrel protein [Clostridiales bacterium]|jgi:deoxyribonuclease-4|nr:TIM barrel protein [Clostridiales bacterium]
MIEKIENKIRFGPSGNCQRFYDEGYKHTYQAAQWLKKLDLNAFEYSFGRGVNIGEDTAKVIAKHMGECDIEVSVHAPYYINLANPEPEMIAKSFDYVLNSIKAVKHFSGKRVVLHSGVQGKEKDRDVPVDRVVQNFRKLMEYLDLNTDGDFILCPETMGKYSQIGNYQEIVSLCKIDRRIIPCLDFGHMNCTLQGQLQKVEDFKAILNYCIEHLGRDKMQNVHVHFSQIQYGKAGEIRHLTFEDKVFGPSYKLFIEAIIDCKLSPFVIVESNGTQADDAFTMSQYFKTLVRL